MRKILSGITAAILSLSIMGTTYHAKAMTMDQAQDMVDKTNQEIDRDIQRPWIRLMI